MVMDKYYRDSIIRELHEIRQKILAGYGNDVKAMLKDFAAHPIPGARYERIKPYANRAPKEEIDALRQEFIDHGLRRVVS